MAALIAIAALAVALVPPGQSKVQAQTLQASDFSHLPSTVYLPNPSPMWTDSPVQILQMCFDHSGPTPESPNDGLDICYNMLRRVNSDLNHKGQGRGLGEFDTDHGNNEPALYVAGTENVDIKVRFKVNLALIPNGVPFLSRADIKATVSSGTWLAVSETTVNFDHISQYSIEGGSYFVTMRLGTAGAKIPAGLNWHDMTWSWSMRNQVHIDGTRNDPEISLGTTQHVFITVLGVPTAPWYSMPGQHPSVSLLKVMIQGTADAGSRAMSLGGITSKTELMEKLAEKLYSHGGRKFSHNFTCLPLYADHLVTDKVQRVCPESYVSGDRTKINKWMLPNGKFDQMEGKWVHAIEQAVMLRVLSGLVGVDSTLMRAGPFGYLKTQAMMGTGPGESNHVFFRECHKNGMQQKRVTTNDWEETPNTLVRYFRHFKDLQWVEYGDKAYDSLAGPHLGTGTRGQYFTAMRATDTLLPGGVVNPLTTLVNNEPVPIALSDETSEPIVHTPWVGTGSSVSISMAQVRLGPFEITDRKR